MRSLIIIPAFNEEESIVKTVRKLESIINNSKYDINYIVINDGSYDNTKNVLEDNNINHVNHVTNMGVGSAIKTGILYANMHSYDAVTQFDADGQHNAEYISDLIEGILEGNDVVIGSRFLSKRKQWSLRMLGSKILSNLIWIKSGFKQKITDPTSGQRIMSKRVMDTYIQDASSSEPSFVIKYFNKGFKIKEVNVVMNDRELGTSYFNAITSVEFMLEQSLAIIFGY